MNSLQAWLLIIGVPRACGIGPELFRALLDPEGAPRRLSRYRRGRFARLTADRGYHRNGGRS